MTSAKTIEERLQLIEDREAIMRLLLDIQDSLDGRDLKAYGDCFTEDGEWSGVTGHYVGPAAITEFFTRICKPWESEAQRTYHTTSDIRIDIKGDMAKVASQWRHIMRGEKGEPVVVHHGHYDDRVRRTAKGWLFTRRAAYGDIPYFEPKFQLIGLAAADAADAANPAK